MATQNRRGGCGCCGCLGGFFVLLFALILAGTIFFFFNATNNAKRIASSSPGPLPAITFNRQTYGAARQKFDHFFADQAERSLTLSNAEVNALLADSPELGVLRRGTVALLNQSSAEVTCSVPLDIPFFPRRYFNCSFQAHPAIRGDEFQLGVSRIEKEGRPMDPAEIREVQVIVLPLVEKTLSTLNKIQGDRSVHSVRIENGNLVLAR
jgi:hypothetical protein